MLVYGGEDEFVDEDMRKSCSQLTVIVLVSQSSLVGTIRTG